MMKMMKGDFANDEAKPLPAQLITANDEMMNDALREKQGFGEEGVRVSLFEKGRSLEIKKLFIISSLLSNPSPSLVF